MKSLSYNHEDDRCYGAVGMAIGMVIFDGEEYLDSVNIDAETDELVSLSSSFYFAGSPSFSVKAVWTRMLNNFNLMTAMVISNALCRTIVHEKMPVRYEIKQQLHDIIAAEAFETCSLEKDELERLFDKNYNYLFHVFNHHAVQDIAHSMAQQLKQTRSMSRFDVLENLKSLSMI